MLKSDIAAPDPTHPAEWSEYLVNSSILRSIGMFKVLKKMIRGRLPSAVLRCGYWIRVKNLNGLSTNGE